ncbi:MAG: VanZ family protein [Candidatus Aminicenantaceae bacterium]
MAKQIKDSPFLPVYGYAILLLGLMSVPTPSLLRLQRKSDVFAIIFSDYTFHFLGFGLLAWLFCVGFNKTRKGRVPCILVGLVSVGYGLFIEVCQIFIPYRTFGLHDLIADAVGVVAGLFVFYLFRRRLKV